TFANIKDLTVDHLQVYIPEQVYAKFPRSALSLHNVESADLSHIKRVSDAPGKGAAVVVMEDCRDGFLSGCKALAGTDVFLSVSGEKTKNISLAANDLKQAGTAVKVASDVTKTEVNW
ncbi:MAG: hypothetical protein OEW48_12710, partial [Phycisphaerae bacterium]|nr:hypothetical protein [Phycisphaerae bacterium]